MNKVLESEKKKVKAMYYDNSLRDFKEEEFQVAPIQVKEIFNCVTRTSRQRMKGYKELCVSLATKGMIDPIIIIENTPYNWDKACYGVKSEFINLNSREGKRWLALTGNSRMSFAEEYKYDYIDSIIVESFTYMHAVQLILQNGVIKHETEYTS